MGRRSTDGEFVRFLQIAMGSLAEADARDVDDAVAAARKALLYPDLLAGVARVPALNQPDGIHPNAAGVRVIAARLAPVVARALAPRP